MGNKRIVLFAFLAAGFLAGCFNPLSSPDGPVTAAKVLVVQIAGESPADRTALPPAPEPAQYTISVSRGGDSLGGDTFPAGSESYPVELTEAPKKDDVVTVAGLNGSGVKIAGGSHTLTESDISGNSVSITLYPLTEGKGNVDLSVSFNRDSGDDAGQDDEITKVTLKLYKSLDDYTEGNTPIKQQSYGTGGTGFTGTDPATSIPIKYDDLESGNYVVMIEFFRGAAGDIRVSRLIQTIIVRGGLTTDRWDNTESGVLTWNAFASSNADLALEGGIKLDGDTIADYSPGTQTYNIYEATTSVPPGKTLTVTAGEPGQAIAVSLNGAAEGFLVSNTARNLTFNGYTNTLVIRVTAPDGFTEKSYTVNISGKEIIDFYFTIGGKHYGVGPGTENDSGSISDSGIMITVPYGTDISSLTPHVIHSGKTISPEAGTAWGSSPNPHTYTVTAVDGTTRDYVVRVYKAKNTAKELMAFRITSPVIAEGVIDQTAKTVTVNVPYGTDVTNMSATASRSEASSIDPYPEPPRDYTSAVTYTVTAEDGTTRDYTVTVNRSPGITITINGFSALSFSGVPPSVDVSASVTITISGGAVTDWYVDINGPVTPTGSTANTVTFKAPSTPGFYNVNVFATVNGIPYSGSFGLVVN